jgi:hypothetical protein
LLAFSTLGWDQHWLGPTKVETHCGGSPSASRSSVSGRFNQYRRHLNVVDARARQILARRNLEHRLN